MRIKYQLLLFLLLVSVIPMLALTYFSYQNTVTLLTNNTSDTLEQGTTTKTDGIENFLSTAKSDVLFLSQSPSLNSVINGGNKTDLETLQKEFFQFSKVKEIYYQMRYIDEKGKEIVRVDYNVSGGHRVISESELQNKSDRYYFTEAMQKSAGEVFISPLDLNKEEGEIENRGSEDNPSYVPVIRYAVRVFDNNNNSKGIVITNIYAQGLLSSLRQSSFGEMLLINRDGFYLVHPDTSKEWGFMFNNNENLKNDYPNIDQTELAANISGKLSLPESIAHYQTISVNDHFWTLLNVIPKDEIKNAIKADAFKILWASLILIILFIVLSIWLSFFLTKPIQRMVSYSKGDVTIDPKDIRRKDEIGDLAKSFERMNASIEFMSQNQEDQKCKTK